MFADDASGWITILREPSYDYTRPGNYPGDAIVSLFNCSDRPLDVPVPGIGDRDWSLRVSTDASSYGGEDRIPANIEALPYSDGPKRLLDKPKRQTLRMPPWSAATYVSL